MAASLGRRSATSLVCLLARTRTLGRWKAAARQSVSGPAMLRARSFGVTHQVLSTMANIPAWKDEHATISNTVTSPVVTAQQTRSLDQALKQLDIAVKRTGRIRYQLLNDVLRDIVRLDFPGQNHLLLLLRSCGNLMAETLPAERTKFAQAIWKKFGDLGVSYDDSHYNSLLKVYLQNEHTFSPTEFLAQMEKDGVAPNRVTYQRLLARYCNEGNMDGTSTVLEFMKAQDMPLTEHVFSALIIGHTRAGDMASAINVLSVMKDVGIEPSAETHMVMLCAFAEKGDFESIRQFFENENQDVNLLNRHLLEVVYALAKFGHDQHIDFIIRRLQHKHLFISENMNVCLRLVTQRLLEPAFQLLRFTCEGITEMKNKAFVANLFLKHLISRNVPLETITKYCDLMIEEGMHNNPHENTLLFLLRLDEVDKVIALMKIFQRMGLPIRQHYFWPMLVLQRKVNDKAGVLYILKTMQELEVPPDMETFVKFVQPAFNSLQEATVEFQKCGISFEHSERIVAHIRNITDKGHFEELYELLVFLKSQNIRMTLAAFHKNLISSYWNCADEKLKAQILHLSTSQSYGNPKDSVGEFLLSLFSRFPNNLPERTHELSQLFAELKSLGVFLGVSDIIEITTFLKTRAPSLIEDVKMLEGGNSIAEKLQLQEIILKEKKAEGKPIDLMLRNVIRVASKQDMAKALELMNTYSEDVKEATYNDVIETACSHQDFDTGWKLKKELNARYPSYVLDLRKQLGLAMGLALHDRTEEFQTILHELPHQNHKQQLVVGLKYKLTELIMQGKAAEAHQLLKTLYDFELIIMNKSLFLPFVSVPLEKGDLAEALDSFIECVQKYNRYPNEYELFSAMVKANDPELLKKALEAVSDEEYETRVLFNLFFAFLGCKKYKEAEKVIETPAIRAQPRMLQWFAEKCVAENEADILEHMVQMTENLPDCDRDQLYYYLLQICDKNGDSARAQVAWTRIQEENIVPREQTSQLLGTILHGRNPVESGVTSEDFSERRGHVVEPEVHQISRIESFILAEAKRKPDETLNLLRMNDRGHGFSASTYLHLAKTQLSIGAVNEAQSIMELAKIHHPSIVLDNIGNSLLMTSLVIAGKLEETIELFKYMRKQGQFPNIFALRPCMKALARAGRLEDVDLFCKEHAALEAPSQIPPHFFVQCQILALIARNQLQQAVEVVEGMWEQQADGNFPLYAVFKVLKEDCKDEAFDKFCAIADKKAQQFGKYDNLCEVLFVHLDRGELNEAKHLLQRWPMIADQELTSWYERNNRKRRDVQIIEKFLEVFPNFQHQYLSYRFLLHHYYFENDFPKAKALYERTKAAQLQLDDLTLKQLAIMYNNSSETLPFPEPPELLSHYTKEWRKPQQQGEHNEPSLNLS